MPSKRYRLIKDHPYAKAGTIVTEKHTNRTEPTPKIYIRLDSINDASIPLAVIDDWLEEVKEGVMFTKEQLNTCR